MPAHAYADTDAKWGVKTSTQMYPIPDFSHLNLNPRWPLQAFPKLALWLWLENNQFYNLRWIPLSLLWKHDTWYISLSWGCSLYCQSSKPWGVVTVVSKLFVCLTALWAPFLHYSRALRFWWGWPQPLDPEVGLRPRPGPSKNSIHLAVVMVQRDWVSPPVWVCSGALARAVWEEV